MTSCKSCTHWHKNSQGIVPSEPETHGTLFGIRIRHDARFLLLQKAIRNRVLLHNRSGACRLLPEPCETDPDHFCGGFAAKGAATMTGGLIWHPMNQPPAVEPGNDARVLVAWRSRTDASRDSSAEMYYLNGRELFFDEPPAGMEPQSSGFYVCTGWYERVAWSQDSVTYEPMDEQFVEHLGWTHMPIMLEAKV